MQPHITHGQYEAAVASYCLWTIQGKCNLVSSMGDTRQLQPHIACGRYEAVAEFIVHMRCKTLVATFTQGVVSCISWLSDYLSLTSKHIYSQQSFIHYSQCYTLSFTSVHKHLTCACTNKGKHITSNFSSFMFA